MGLYLLKTCCCGCRSLRTGTLIAGFAAIALAILGIILVLVLRIDIKTFLFENLDRWIVQTVLVINLVMTIILSTLMIIGVCKRNWYLMIPWVVLGAILPIGLIISVVFNCIHFFMDNEVLAGSLVIVGGLIFLVIYCYMWYVAFSYFVNLRKESERGSYSRDPFRRQRI